MTQLVSDVESYTLGTVAADDSLLDATEYLAEHAYTQAGVEDDGEIIGMVSHRSISALFSVLKRLGKDGEISSRPVRLAITELEPVVSPDDDLIVLFDLLAENSYVLVEAESEYEILTNYDLLHHLRDTMEPFLLIEDIETNVRRLLRSAYPDDLESELDDFFSEKDIRTPRSAADCSFGHYEQFIQENFPRAFEPAFEEHGDFVGELLSEVGAIRNKVFHFRADSFETTMEEEFLRFAHEYFKHRTLSDGS